MRQLRLTAATAGFVLVASLVAAAPAVAAPSSAGSSRKPPKPIVCQAMAGGGSTAVVVSRCSRRGVTGLSGSLGECPTGTNTCITWATGKEIAFTISFTVPSESRCGSLGLVEADVVGTVSSASGANTKRLIGAPVTYDACLTDQINVSTDGLVPGTVFTIG